MTERYDDQEEEIIEGVILKADFGYGMKYKDEENLYLKLEVQQFDGYECVQLFGEEKIGKLLQQFKGDYRGEVSVNTLIHRRVYLLGSDMTNSIPNAISKLPPSRYQQYDWVYNDNWN
jgi:hypothetical protein